MITDLFTNNHTMGSHDNLYMADNISAQIQTLGQRMQNLEQQNSVRDQLRYDKYQCCENHHDHVEPQQKKSKWKKFQKFFAICITPILCFIPNVINALANYKKAAVLLKA